MALAALTVKSVGGGLLKQLGTNPAVGNFLNQLLKPGK
jgi:hypothetical protein